MFNVVKIINGNTIQVSPGWKWGEFSGSQIKINGYNVPGSQYDSFAVSKLTTLIMGKPIDLKNPLSVKKEEAGGEILTCSVFLNDVDISQYFPELKESKA